MHVEHASPTLPSARAARYEPFIEGIRGLLASYVVFHHVYSVLGSFNAGDREPLAPYLDWFSYGHNAVAAFIFVSGLCLGLPVVRRLEAGEPPLSGGAVRFYKARARRILPAYYAVIVVCVTIGLLLARTGIAMPNDYFLPLQPSAVVGGLLLVPNFFSSANGVGVIWSLGVELQIYLLFPLMCWFWRRSGLAALLCLTLVLASLCGKYMPRDVGPLHLTGSTRGLLPTFYVVFVMGLIAAKLLRGSSATAVALRERLPWGVLLLTSIIVMFMRDFVFGLRGDMNDYLIGFYMLLVTLTVYRHRAVRWVLERPIPVQLGTFSYSLYLTHLMVITLTYLFIYQRLMPANMQGQFFRAFMFMIAVGYPLACGVAWIFARLFEWPFMNSRARKAATTHYRPPDQLTPPSAPPSAGASSAVLLPTAD